MPGEMRCEEEEEEEEEEEGEDGKAGEGSRVTAADEGNEESQLPGGRAGLEEWGEETTAAPSSGAPRVILPANQLYGDRERESERERGVGKYRVLRVERVAEQQLAVRHVELSPPSDRAETWSRI
ncbi:hypothetical protein B296_00032170 [Ensete ventricosum]|uniref:Uncharacterized protein n=1 Tax=Ensete ventricosum TaxID=4639 RepID=A0A426ZXS0_ENSVE|nr:hypothetical protein B296_00032170 [Ensete ventricosum]